MMRTILNVVRRRPVLWGGAGLLVAALLIAWGLRSKALDEAQRNMSERRTALADAALSTVAAEFADLRDDVRARARTLAQDSVVIHELRDWSPGDDRPAGLIRHVAEMRTGERTALEVYAPTPQLLAWSGVRMPLDRAPDSKTFLESPQLSVSTDGDVRRGLAMWWPVRNEGTTVGVVRVVRVVEYQPPVQNRFIRGFSLEAEWSRETHEPVAVAWGAAAPSDDRMHVPLKGEDGTIVGRASVSPPPVERVLKVTEAPYNDAIALVVALLFLWASAGAWVWYAGLARRDGAGAWMRARRAILGRFAVGALIWWSARYAFLELDVPARFQSEEGLFAPLFDPSHLASTFGFGLMRSTGDLLITAAFGVLFAVAFMHLAARFRLQAPSLTDLAERVQTTRPQHPSSYRFLTTLLGTVGFLLAALFFLAAYVRRAVLDSTLDFFSRTGLLPQPLVLVVLCALFLLVVATVLISVAMLWISLRMLVRYRPVWWARGMPILSVAVTVALTVAVVYLTTPAWEAVPLPVTLLFLGIVAGVAAWGLVWSHEGFGQLTLRTLLPAILVLTLLLYPMLYNGMDTQRREHMTEAASSFEAGRDPRVVFSIEQILGAAGHDLGPLLDRGRARRTPAIDSVATRLMRRSLLASLTNYEASFTLFDADGTPLRRYTAAGVQTRRTTPSAADRAAFERLRSAYQVQNRAVPLVEQLRSEQLNDRSSAAFQYAGLVAFPDTTGPDTTGPAAEASDAEGDADGPGAEGSGETPGPAYWGLLRADPRSLLPGTGGGVPRVLLPDGSYSDLYAELSLAEFRGGRLMRSLGRDFGRAQLPEALRSGVATDGDRWRNETVRDRQYLTYYRAHDVAPERTSVIAVRIPAILAFDHLYYLLRLTVAGLCVGIVAYLIGVWVRYRRGLLPAPTVRFRDKVLNAFLIVGVVSMIAVGVVGVQVVTGENERVIERRLHDDLSRVEQTLAMQADTDERIYRVARRIDVDFLAARVGLDVHIYENGRLVGTSRPRLVRDRLVDERLPADVYHALYGDAYRFTSAQASIGPFDYMVGFQALTDEEGRPQVVIAVPTLAQQERIEEEKARTLAYLFGALLLLVVVVMLTALLLSNALARPIAQLREGLEAVGEGRFTRVLPVDTRDEIGDLVQTFNEMREQLAESRRKLAQQERELAWREMARQVAHEIKNPLTPMKLSIQHLRRAFERERTVPSSGDGDPATSDRFAGLFDRITSTLIEQIEALARIADEFSTFARLPTRVMESLDLNEVIREAADLMREESEGVQIDLDLYEDPLVVEADREELRRIYINLIKNAMQAVPDHRDGRIEIATTTVAPSGDASPGVRSTISDNGTGIPEDLQDKIFQPNFSTKTSGTGLGLAIARKGIEELDGQIGFETTEGEGTTFWIHLPLSEEASVEVDSSG